MLPAVPPTNQPPRRHQGDFFYSSQSKEPSRQLCKETDCIQTDSAVWNFKKNGALKVKFGQFGVSVKYNLDLVGKENHLTAFFRHISFIFAFSISMRS